MKVSRQGATWHTTSPDETQALGQALGRVMAGGITIGLAGPLGAGKTQLVKGIAVGNALKDARQVTSPTFTLVHEYPGRLTLYHLDAYRLIVNLDYGSPLHPPKRTLRSEPLDFQRGEVEIDGRNLYYDEWDWDFRCDVEALTE